MAPRRDMRGSTSSLSHLPVLLLSRRGTLLLEEGLGPVTLAVVYFCHITRRRVTSRRCRWPACSESFGLAMVPVPSLLCLALLFLCAAHRTNGLLASDSSFCRLQQQLAATAPVRATPAPNCSQLAQDAVLTLEGYRGTGELAPLAALMRCVNNGQRWTATCVVASQTEATTLEMSVRATVLSRLPGVASGTAAGQVSIASTYNERGVMDRQRAGSAPNTTGARSAARAGPRSVFLPTVTLTVVMH